MRGLSGLEIAVELLAWRDRLTRNITSLELKDRQWISDFADYLLHRDRNRHLHDLQVSVEAFVGTHRNLWDWYNAVRMEGPIKIAFLEGQPRIALDSFTAWRTATARLDHDALLTHAMLDRLPSRFDPGDALSSLDRWGVFPVCRDNDLERILRGGIADTHVHFEASDPIPLLWARLVHGVVNLQAIPRYSFRDMAAITNTPERLDRREFEERTIREALRARRTLVKRVGMRLSPPASGVEYLFHERYLLLSVWRLVRDGLLDADDLNAWDSYLFAKGLFHSEQQQFSGSGAGLSRFRQYLDRGESLTEAKAEKSCKRARLDRMRRLVDFAIESPDLRLIELRIAPKKHMRDYVTAFSLWERILANHPRLNGTGENGVRIGFIIHFIRKTEDLTVDTPLFFGLRKLLDRHSAVLHLFRLKHPNLARHIVGIDVANLERGCPPEIFAPFLKQLRGHDMLSRKGTVELAHWERLKEAELHHHPFDLPVLGQTYHVGEDYYHIVDGIRHMDCVGRFLLECGDRIGHGLAVGANPKTIAHNRGAPIHIMNGILLDNLVWLRHRGASFGCLNHADMAMLESAVHRLSTDIYGEPVDVPLLAELQKRRYELPPGSLEGAATSLERLFASHLYDRRVRSRRHERALPEMAGILDQMPELIIRLQDEVVRSFRRKGVVIESNPTSNLATGAVASMDEHPMLRHLRVGNDVGLFSVNTDDPGVFATRIESEYGMVFSAMLKTMERSEALSLIDGLRRTAWESSFIHRMAPERG